MNSDAFPDVSTDEQRPCGDGDALADSVAPPLDADLDSVMDHIRHVVASAPPDRTDVSIAPEIKARIWEDIMHQVALTPPTPLDRPTRPVRRGAARPPQAPIPHAAPARRREWGATIGVSVMLAIAIGLVGVFVALRFDGPVPQGPSEGVPLFAAPTEPTVHDSCTPNGVVPDTADLSKASLADLPEPLYTPAKPVSYEQGRAIQQTYLAFLRCQEDAYDMHTPVPTTPELVTTDALRSYYTERMLLLEAASTSSPEQQAEALAYVCRPVATELLASFPLPVNRPAQYATMKQASGDLIYQQIFAPSDVFQLPDGRYGAMIGTISSAALRDPETQLTLNDGLTFVAFVEQDGRYSIDESILVLAPDRTKPIVDPPPSDTPRTEVTYHRLVNPACAPNATPSSASSPASGS